MKRTKRVVTLAIAFILCMSLSISSFAASDEEKKEKVTEAMAVQMAERFGEAVAPDMGLRAQNPIKFYSTDGKAIGYIVDYYNDTEPYGYIIFDSTGNSSVSEYSIGAESKNPYMTIVNKNSLLAEGRSDKRLYKTAPYEYGILDETANKIVNNYGETKPAGNIESNLNRSGDKDPAEWNDVFFEMQDIYEDYNLVTTNHLNQFIAYSEPYIEGATGHYACAISALYACAEFYGALDYSDVSGDYMGLWDATGTTQSSESGGIIYGSTNIYDIGPGFVDFCADKGINVTENTTDNPNYNFFTNCIDGGNIAVVHCGIISVSTGERSGHSMAVQGYATIQNKGSGSQIHTLMVFDGWNEYVKYLNLNFGSWTDLRGTTFNG